MSAGNQYNNLKSVNLNNVSEACEALKNTLLNFVRGGGDDLCLGAGYCHPFPDQVCEVLNIKAKKEEAESKTHIAMLKKIQNHIKGLRAEIEVLQAKIDDLYEKIDDNKEKIAKYDEQLEKLKAQGKEGSPEWLAIIAMRDAVIDANDGMYDLIEGFEGQQAEIADEIKGLEYISEHGTDAELEERLDQSSNHVLVEARKSSDQEVAIKAAEKNEVDYVSGETLNSEEVVVKKRSSFAGRFAKKSAAGITAANSVKGLVGDVDEEVKLSNTEEFNDVALITAVASGVKNEDNYALEVQEQVVASRPQIT